jgi:hypothetical protein
MCVDMSCAGKDRVLKRLLHEVIDSTTTLISTFFMNNWEKL